jgi:putative addiction module component (TIGR02574 family)
MTVDEICEETSKWPRETVSELVDRLTLELHTSIAPEIESAWKNETRRRMTEIESGEIQAIPGEKVSARIRQILRR